MPKRDPRVYDLSALLSKADLDADARYRYTDLAAAVFQAGWRPTLQVDTVEQMDDLAPGSVILDFEGHSRQVSFRTDGKNYWAGGYDNDIKASADLVERFRQNGWSTKFTVIHVAPATD